MGEGQDFNELAVDTLTKMLDPDDKTFISLDRLLALASKLSKDSKNEEISMYTTGLGLLKASFLLTIVVVVGMYVFIGVEHDNYDELIAANLLLKDDLEEALPIGNFTDEILELSSMYDRELDNTIRAIYWDWKNQSLWDQLDDSGFISTYSIQNPWKFESAGWFVFSIITTIGWGHISPTTEAGRWFVIFYSIPSIISMAYFIKKVVDFYRSCPCYSDVLETQALTVIVYFTTYLFLGGWVVSVFEEWTVTEGIYYIWVSVSTIGFGDYTIGDENWWQIMVTLFITLNGLFLFSLVVTVVASVFERITKPERWNEEFNRSTLDKIECIRAPAVQLAEKSAAGLELLSPEGIERD